MAPLSPLTHLPHCTLSVGELPPGPGSCKQTCVARSQVLHRSWNGGHTISRQLPSDTPCGAHLLAMPAWPPRQQVRRVGKTEELLPLTSL